MALADDIELLVFRSPGVTEAELVKELFGNRAYQQRVNSTCRRLIQQGRVMRHGNGGPGDPFTYHPGLSKPSGGRQKQMIGPVYERGVAVGGRLQNIIVYQKTKAVWVATASANLLLSSSRPSNRLAGRRFLPLFVRNREQHFSLPPDPHGLTHGNGAEDRG